MLLGWESTRLLKSCLCWQAIAHFLSHGQLFKCLDVGNNLSKSFRYLFLRSFDKDNVVFPSVLQTVKKMNLIGHIYVPHPLKNVGFLPSLVQRPGYHFLSAKAREPSTKQVTAQQAIAKLIKQPGMLHRSLPVYNSSKYTIEIRCIVNPDTIYNRTYLGGLSPALQLRLMKFVEPQTLAKLEKGIANRRLPLLVSSHSSPKAAIFAEQSLLLGESQGTYVAHYSDPKTECLAVSYKLQEGTISYTRIEVKEIGNKFCFIPKQASYQYDDLFELIENDVALEQPLDLDQAFANLKSVESRLVETIRNHASFHRHADRKKAESLTPRSASGNLSDPAVRGGTVEAVGSGSRRGIEAQSSAPPRIYEICDYPQSIHIRCLL